SGGEDERRWREDGQRGEDQQRARCERTAAMRTAPQQSTPTRAKAMAPDSRPRSTLTRFFRRADIVHMALRPLKGPFTVDTYQRLGALGILGEDDRVELIGGQVVEMSPIGDRHASASATRRSPT